MAFDHAAGWMAVEGLITPDEIAAILATADNLGELPPEQRHPRDKPAAATRHIAAVDQRIPLVAALVARSPLAEVVDELVGPEAALTEAEVRSPQPGHGDQRLHADDVPLVASAGPANVATAIVALVDFTSANGATRVVPGSHRRPDLQRQSGQLTQHPDEIVLTGPAGTAFVFNGHLLHSGTKNVTGHNRPALHLVWRRR